MPPKVPVNHLSDLEENDYESSERDIVVHRGYERPEIVHHEDDTDDLSDHVKFRLFLARHLAMKKFREKHGQA
jgi:hypothetical protein